MYAARRTAQCALTYKAAAMNSLMLALCKATTGSHFTQRTASTWGLLAGPDVVAITPIATYLQA